MTAKPSATGALILDYLRAQRDHMVYFLHWLALAESPTLDPESQRQVFDLLADKLVGLHFRVRWFPGRESGGLLYARPRARVSNAPCQLLLGHSDTVWPRGTVADMPVTIKDGRMAGPGVYDMKSGLAQIVFALQAIDALGLEPFLTPLVLINSDEETGSGESVSAIRRFAKLVDRVLVLEPSLGPTGKIKTARKGVMRFNIVVRGKAAHAGLAPEEGVSAILELSYVIQKLFQLNDSQRGVTVNVGAVDGGLRPNVIAPESKAQVDVRTLNAEDAQRVAQQIMALQAVTPGTSIQVEQLASSPPMERTPRNRRLWELARELGYQIGLDLEEGISGGGSDGNTTSQYTATLDGLGPVGAGAHARHEYVELSTMVERTTLLALLILAPALA
jgi:glutamate carboxypeptidase